MRVFKSNWTFENVIALKSLLINLLLLLKNYFKTRSERALRFFFFFIFGIPLCGVNLQLIGSPKHASRDVEDE